jgi:hypothetical protein
MPTCSSLRSLLRALAHRRGDVAVRWFLILCAATGGTACAWMRSHSRGGEAWLQVCRANGFEGCPCHQNKDCATSWCVSGECEELPE